MAGPLITLSDLFEKLHNALTSFAADIEELVETDKRVASEQEIVDLRERIKEKLKKKEDLEDRTKVINLLNLLISNEKVLELIKDDAEEWIALLDAIEDNVSSKAVNTEQEKKEIEEIKALTKDLTEVIRKS